MIEFSYQTNFTLEKSKEVAAWISEIIISEGYVEGEISFVFCDDEYLFKLNKEFLEHDTLTDIISFDYSLGKELHGEIYISIDRVRENAVNFEVSFDNELHRVIIHGILHYCGYKDKTEIDASIMRKKEDEALLTRRFC
jgi:rRNA maturation RNase YbeY